MTTNTTESKIESLAHDEIISATLRKMALSTLELEGEGEDRCLSAAIPLPLARELASRLIACGIEASVAKDNDDPELAWVYIAPDDERE